MSVKTGLENLLNRLIEGYKTTEKGLPMRPYTDRFDKRMYIGEPNKNGWCRWRPLAIEEKEEFSLLEEELGIELHNDIKELYSSYYFLSFDIILKRREISLNPVIPEKIVLNLKKSLISYKESHDGKLEYIPIGMELNNNYVIVVENMTGIVKFENYETGKRRKIANNLEEFLLNLEPDII